MPRGRRATGTQLVCRGVCEQLGKLNSVWRLPGPVEYNTGTPKESENTVVSSNRAERKPTAAALKEQFSLQTTRSTVWILERRMLHQYRVLFLSVESEMMPGIGSNWHLKGRCGGNTKRGGWMALRRETGCQARMRAHSKNRGGGGERRAWGSSWVLGERLVRMYDVVLRGFQTRCTHQSALTEGAVEVRKYALWCT